jgi:hypothetical protein
MSPDYFVTYLSGRSGDSLPHTTKELLPMTNLFSRLRHSSLGGDARMRLPSVTMFCQPSASRLQPLIKARPWTAAGADIAPTY